MFRISTTEERSCTLLTIDGRLSNEYIAVVEECCGRAISTGRPVHLFLRHVTTVDHAGFALLCRLAARGVRIRAIGVYTSYLVKTLCPSNTTPPNSTLDADGSDGDETKRKP
jgi:ABC-type transporter Mla MlaB component